MGIKLQINCCLVPSHWQATTPASQGTYVLPGGFGKDEYQRLEGLGDREKNDPSSPNCHMAVRKPQ